MSASDVAKSAACNFGGLAEIPTIAYNELRPPEVIEPASLQPWAHHTFYAYRSLGERQLSVQSMLDDISMYSAEYLTEFAEHHDWAAKIWVADHETFDPKTNVLTCYGYYRIYLFPIWVQTS